MLIDSHCHLYMGSGFNDLDGVITRAVENDVGKIICPGIDIESSLQSAQIAIKYEEVFAAAGIHPHDAKDTPGDFIEQLKELLSQPKVIAVGEIGLDFYRNISDSDVQYNIFRKQLQLAKDLDLPVIIHNRNADDDIISALREVSPIRGVAHCFSSDLETAKILMELGLYISFAGNLTYKNSNLTKVAKELPIDKILIETDAPFLSPMPFRGKENEPHRVKIVAEKLAECKGVSYKVVEESTRNNTEQLFNLPSN